MKKKTKLGAFKRNSLNYQCMKKTQRYLTLPIISFYIIFLLSIKMKQK